MNETFRKDAEKDVDRQESGEDQDRFVMRDCWLSQQGGQPKNEQGGRGTPIRCFIFDGRESVAERDDGARLKEMGDGGKQMVGVDGEWDGIGRTPAAMAMRGVLPVLEVTLPLLDCISNESRRFRASGL